MSKTDLFLKSHRPHLPPFHRGALRLGVLDVVPDGAQRARLPLRLPCVPPILEVSPALGERTIWIGGVETTYQAF